MSWQWAWEQKPFEAGRYVRRASAEPQKVLGNMKYYYLTEAGDVLAEADTIEKCRELGRAEAQRLTGAWHPSQGYIITDSYAEQKGIAPAINARAERAKTRPPCIESHTHEGDWMRDLSRWSCRPKW